MAIQVKPLSQQLPSNEANIQATTTKSAEASSSSSASVTSETSISLSSTEEDPTALVAGDQKPELNNDVSRMSQSSTSSGSSNADRRVRFGTIEIHEHSIELGGAGVPQSGGAPISLASHPTGHFEVPVEEYDDMKTTHRHGDQLLLSSCNRIEL